MATAIATTTETKTIINKLTHHLVIFKTHTRYYYALNKNILSYSSLARN